jgi:hypothetical protein
MQIKFVRVHACPHILRRRRAQVSALCFDALHRLFETRQATRLIQMKTSDLFPSVEQVRRV